MHQSSRPWHHAHAFLMVGLPAFQFQYFRLGVQVRRHALDYLDGADTVRNCHHSIAVHAFAARPLAPFAIYCARRINQNSVQVKKDS
jgi:hypothetical protein